jgi:hypothetical protein
MTEANHYCECGCVLNADGRLVQPCADCAKAALLERTHGIKPPSFMQRLADAFGELPRCL